MVEIVLMGPSGGGKTTMGKRLRDAGFTGPIWEQVGGVVTAYGQGASPKLLADVLQPGNTRIDVPVDNFRAGKPITHSGLEPRLASRGDIGLARAQIRAAAASMTSMDAPC